MNRNWFIPFLILSLFLLDCQPKQSIQLDFGVSKDLATLRDNQISNIEYEIEFNFDENEEISIGGRIDIHCHIKEINEDLVLDFNSSPDLIDQVSIGVNHIEYAFNKGHIIIDKSDLTPDFKLTIQFKVPRNLFKKNANIGYTHFVPNNASKFIPLFDQPSLKSKYSLTLELPKNYIAVSNSSIKNSLLVGNDKIRYTFNQTNAISSYLFFLAVGDLQYSDIADQKIGRIYYAKNERPIINTNLKSLEDLHVAYLNWMEDYTRIDYAFNKLDIILLSDYYLGGMEYPGLIAYKTSSVISESQSNKQFSIERAELIAHEIAHMWVGNYVSISWYDEVWFKEGLAGYFAIKMLKQNYEQEEPIRLLLNKYRNSFLNANSKGLEPLYHDVLNSNDSPLTYNQLVYNKAPLAFIDLENRVGEASFKKAVIKFLNKNANSSAGWIDFKNILTTYSSEDLDKWYNEWILSVEVPENSIVNLEFELKNSMDLMKAFNNNFTDLERSKGWLMRENMLTNGGISAEQLLDLSIKELLSENNPQLASYIANLIDELYWLKITDNTRLIFSSKIESVLVNLLIKSDNEELRGIYFNTLLSIATSDEAMNVIYNLWDNGDNFSESDQVKMALILILQEQYQPDSIMYAQIERITTQELKLYFKFVSETILDLMNNSKLNNSIYCDNESNQNWVNDLLKLAFNPAYEPKLINNLTVILDNIILCNKNDILILEDRIEIVLSGFSSEEAYYKIAEYLSKKSSMPESIRNMVLRSSNHLFELYGEDI